MNAFPSRAEVVLLQLPSDHRAGPFQYHVCAELLVTSVQPQTSCLLRILGGQANESLMLMADIWHMADLKDCMLKHIPALLNYGEKNGMGRLIFFSLLCIGLLYGVTECITQLGPASQLLFIRDELFFQVSIKEITVSSIKKMHKTYIHKFQQAICHSVGTETMAR